MQNKIDFKRNLYYSDYDNDGFEKQSLYFFIIKAEIHIRKDTK